MHWAIIHGETTTGASLHYMVEKPDAGALVDQKRCPSWKMTRRLDVSIKVAAAAEDGAAPQPAAIDRRHRGPQAPGSEARFVFRPAPAGGWAHRLALRRAAPCTIWCAPSRRLFRVPLPR